ncbi:MAG: TolC family protein, partial [Leptospira sp.]|nr:TolC family protein [Leptospira sp.]
VIDRLKNDKDIAENYWIPKLYVGGYFGRNGDQFPLRHDAYGFNFALNFPLGSTTTQTTGNLGVQKDGNGIQRYSGYGNQFVGPGTNGYSSSTIQFFDNLSYSRKILESKLQLTEAIENHKVLENTVTIEANKAVDRLNESWEMIRLSNSRVMLQFEALKIMNSKLGLGHGKKGDVVNAEIEFLKAQEELSDAISNYISGVYDLSLASSLPPEFFKMIQYSSGKGNTLIAELLHSNRNYFGDEKQNILLKPRNIQERKLQKK